MRQAVCEQCGKEFMFRQGKGRFCSQQCVGYWNSKGGLLFYKNPGRWIIKGRNGSRTYFYRAVVEAQLGRELTPNEVVHHIDGNRTNDDPSNLEVMTRAEHVLLHHLNGDIPNIGEWRRDNLRAVTS